MSSFLDLIKNHQTSFENHQKFQTQPTKTPSSNNVKASIEISNEIFKTGGIKNDQIEIVFSIEKLSEKNYVPQFEPLSEEEIEAGTWNDIGTGAPPGFMKFNDVIIFSEEPYVDTL